MDSEQREQVNPGDYICPYGYCLQVEAAQEDGMVFFVRLLPNVKNYTEARSWLEAKKRTGEWMDVRGFWLGHEMRVAGLQEGNGHFLRARLELRHSIQRAA